MLDLKNKGIYYDRKYYFNGIISYNKINTVEQLQNYLINEETTLVTSPLNELKVLAISDLHYGHTLERLGLVDKAYNYCKKNGINIIFNCGDFIDGTFSAEEKRISNIYEQIEFFIEKYPFDKNILTFGVGGNHDISALNDSYQDFLEILKNYRHDVIVPAYNNVVLNIKNDKILLHYYFTGGFTKRIDVPLILEGHAHEFKVKNEKNV